jgi:putative transposase
VLKLMRSLRLVCNVRKKKRYSSYQGGQCIIAPNLLNREFEAKAPNQKWVTDVTEFTVGKRKLYLSPVMDLFERQIISYSVGQSPNLKLTNTSLRDALTTLECGQNRSCIRTRDPVPARLVADPSGGALGAAQSVSRKGNCYDCQSFSVESALVDSEVLAVVA